MTAVIDSEALEDVRAAEALGNDHPDGRFMRDVHGRLTFRASDVSGDSTGSSMTGPGPRRSDHSGA